MKKLAFLLLAIVAIGFSSCTEDELEEQLPVSVTKVTLNHSNLSLTVGEDSILTVTVTPADAAIIWISSNAAVASVAGGKVTALTAGTTTITVKAGDKTASCIITVADPVIASTSLKLSNSVLNRPVGAVFSIVASVHPTSATCTWTSSNPAVATVSDGTVTILASGNTTITAQAGDKTATCKVDAYTPSTVTDIDGNVYHTVTIGTQTWMVENLKVTHYKDGTAIPNVTDNTAWTGLSSGAYCYYNNSVANSTKYGALYNWYAVNTGKLAPSGWHVPTDAEWTVLENYLIANGYNYDGTTTDNKIAKSLAATIDWTFSPYTGDIANDLSRNNSTGFSALPGGVRIDDVDSFVSLGSYGNWWSATEYSTSNAWYRDLGELSSYLSGGYLDKQYGISVRCVKD